MASELAGRRARGSVAKQLEKAYLLAGVKPGALHLSSSAGRTTSRRRPASAPCRAPTSSTQRRTSSRCTSPKAVTIGAIPVHAYISGEGLLLVFPVSRLVDVVTALGDRIPSLATVTKLLKKYENVYVGFEFRK